MEVATPTAAPLDNRQDLESQEQLDEDLDDSRDREDEEEEYREEEDEDGVVEEEEEMVHLEDVLDQLGSDEEDEDGGAGDLEMDDMLSEKKEFQCEYCNYSTNRRSDLNRHVRGHTGENLFHCVKCDYKTARKSDLRRHHLLHAGEKPFKCGVCNYTTSRKAVLLKHMRIHTANLPRSRVILVQVTKDGQKVINNNALAESPSSSTSSQAKSPAKKPRVSSAPVKMYQCDKCDFVAACRKNYHEHRLSHGKEQKWKCPMCGYMTIRKSDMTRHFNIHIDNVFKCNLCEYKTVRHSDFVRHTKTHNKTKFN